MTAGNVAAGGTVPPGTDGPRGTSWVGFSTQPVRDAAPVAVRARAQHSSTTGRRWLPGHGEVVCQVATKIALHRRKLFSIQDFNAESHCEFKPSIWGTYTDCIWVRRTPLGYHVHNLFRCSRSIVDFLLFLFSIPQSYNFLFSRRLDNAANLHNTTFA